MTNAAANSPAISDRHVRDLLGRLLEQWLTHANGRTAQQISVPDQGADRQTVPVGTQTVESFNSIDIHNDSGAEDAQIEHGHQALAAGQHPDVLTGVAQNVQRFVELTRGVVVEPCWFQRDPISR